MGDTRETASGLGRAPQGGESFLITPNNLIAALYGKREGFNIAGLVVSNRSVIPMLTNLAYQRPELFEERKARPRPELNSIRTDFSNLIRMFGNERVAEAIRLNPTMQQRLQAEKDILDVVLKDTERTKIKDIELVLVMLIEDSNPGNLQEGRALNITSSHRAYIALLDSLESSGEMLSKEEEGRFIGLGQELGKNKRALAVDSTELTQEPNLPRGELDFRGRVAQLRALGSLITRLSEQGGTTAIISDLMDSYTSFAIGLGQRYPDRAMEIKNIARTPGLDKFSAHTQEPGAPEFTRAELTDFNQSR